MTTTEWISNYHRYLDEFEFISKTEFKIVFDKLRSIDPHDFVRPDTWFPNQISAKGYVWFLIQRELLLHRLN
jgi:hypothetical protein